MNHPKALRITKDKVNDCLLEDEEYYQYIEKLLLGKIQRKNLKQSNLGKNLLSIKVSLKLIQEKINQMEKDL